MSEQVVRDAMVPEPTMLVASENAQEAGRCLANPEVRDDHDYNQDPASFKKRWMDFFAGAGGLSIPTRYGGGAAGRCRT